MLRVLLVDDDVHVADVLSLGLQHYCSATVICAGNGTAACELLRTDSFDLAVVDIALPDISGFQVAEHAAVAQVPVLLISGHLERQSHCEALGYPYLAKPFSLRSLADAATMTMRHARANIARFQQSNARRLTGAGGAEFAAPRFA